MGFSKSRCLLGMCSLKIVLKLRQTGLPALASEFSLSAFFLPVSDQSSVDVSSFFVRVFVVVGVDHLNNDI